MRNREEQKSENLETIVETNEVEETIQNGKKPHEYKLKDIIIDGKNGPRLAIGRIPFTIIMDRDILYIHIPAFWMNKANRGRVFT